MIQTKYFYFFKTVNAEGKARLRPLPGQTFPAGSPIDPSYNVQADQVVRGSYPIGTMFCSESLELRSYASVPFYSAGQIFPVGLALGDYICKGHVPSTEMSNAFNTFMNASGQSTSSGPTLFPNDAASPENSVNAPKPKPKVKPAANILEEIKTNPQFAVPSISQDGFFISDSNWYLLVRNIKQKINTMMIGPSGTGKTELVMLACKKLRLDCHVYDMGSMYDPVSGLLGVHRLKKGGESVFDYAKFTEDIQKPGVVLLDELSRAPVTTNNILFPCLDSRRMLPVEMAGGENMRSISVHPECVFIATANVGVEYTGTMSLDRALVGRFFPLELNYMPNSEESRVLVQRFKITKSDADNLVSVAGTVRSLYDKGELSCTISTRETLQAAQLVSDGWTALQAMQLTYLPLFEGNTTDGERSVVNRIFVTK